MVDKDLFLHDLSIVAILKNEGPYLKEWLDYHLLAGVDHFYLYDNESPDNQAEVAKPYVEAGLVDYFPLPGKNMQFVAYNDAVKRFKFQCRYMAFIDGDEFIFPKLTGGGTIIDVVDEILSKDWRAAALVVNWHCFGSNGQEKADYSLGVLERFTRRAPNEWHVPTNKIGNIPVLGNDFIKSFANPRRIDLIRSPHYLNYFGGFYAVNENMKHSPYVTSYPIVEEKMIVNHYHVKSLEEYRIKSKRGDALNFGATSSHYNDERFQLSDHNEVFDDGILKYRDARAKVYQPPDKSHADERLLGALMKNLLPTFMAETLQNFYLGKMETFLTCRAVASYLQTKLADSAQAKFFEEASLRAIVKSLDKVMIGDFQLLIRELPKLLALPYPAVKDLRNELIKCMPQIIDSLHMHFAWQEYVTMDHIHDLLKLKECN